MKGTRYAAGLILILGMRFFTSEKESGSRSGWARASTS